MTTTLLSVLDNGGKTFDRYTLTFVGDEGGLFMYGASDDPFHPQGFGQFAGEGGFPDTDEFPEIGLAIDWHELPAQVKKFVEYIESGD